MFSIFKGVFKSLSELKESSFLPKNQRITKYERDKQIFPFPFESLFWLSTVVTLGFNYFSIDNLVELQNIEEFARILKILCPKYLQQSTCKKCFQHRKLVSELDNRCLTELFRSKICNESKQHKECLVQNQLQAQF